MKISAVLISKEKIYPKEVLDSLPKFDEVIIKTECPSVLMRYELAKEAKNDTIYVQDDDCIPQVVPLFDHYNGQITNAMSEWHFNAYKDTGITLVGWGAFFPKSMIDFSPYIDKYGVDELLLSQADRIFSYLNQPHNIVVQDIKHLPTATLGDRMSMNPNHWEKLTLIKQRLHGLSKNNNN